MFSIPDNLWEQIKTKIPSKKTRRGRPEIDAKKALNAIFYVLKTGIHWKALPPSYGAASTIHGKFMKWSRMNVFSNIFEHAKEFYLAKNQDNIWFAIDATHAKAPLANFSGKSPVDRGKRGIKRTVLVDRNGAPLAIAVGAGNAHDSTFFEEVIHEIKTKEKAQILVADSAYDSNKFKKICTARNIAFIPTTNRRRNKNLRVVYPSHRWIVERTLSWFSWYRSLKTCWSKTKISHQSLFSFAAAIQLFRMGGFFG